MAHGVASWHHGGHKAMVRLPLLRRARVRSTRQAHETHGAGAVRGSSAQGAAGGREAAALPRASSSSQSHWVRLLTLPLSFVILGRTVTGHCEDALA